MWEPICHIHGEQNEEIKHTRIISLPFPSITVIQLSEENIRTLKRVSGENRGPCARSGLDFSYVINFQLFLGSNLFFYYIWKYFIPMKKFFVLSFIVLASLQVRSQWLWDYGVRLGASNYLGDIGGKEKTRRDFVADMKLAKTRWDGGVFVRYRWQQRISLKAAFDYIRIEGDDKLSSNPGRNYRNFNFKNDLLDASLTGELFFFEDPDLGNTYRYRNSFRAYIFGGVGGVYTNPKSIYGGKWIKLRDYDIEGYNYRSFVLNIPMGVGFYFTFDKKHRIGFEMNYRMVFTDYLDDISGNYPENPPSYDPAIALRTLQLNPDANPGAYYSHKWGSKRGDPTHKDGYVTASLSYSYVIRGKSSFYRAKKNAFFSRKRKMRKIRAKF